MHDTHSRHKPMNYFSKQFTYLLIKHTVAHHFTQADTILEIKPADDDTI